MVHADDSVAGALGLHGLGVDTGPLHAHVAQRDAARHGGGLGGGEEQEAVVDVDAVPAIAKATSLIQ